MPPTDSSTRSTLAISVVVCTHNPRVDYLQRTLEALAAQTLPRDTWELLLVDNASTDPVAPRIDLSWHPRARHVLETTLGLTPARLHGIANSSGDLIVFVDDDNVLAPDYLVQAIAIHREKPFIGVWGGRVIPEFESPPPPWIFPLLPLLAVNVVERDVWSNYTDTSGTPPCGAGLCVRRTIALAWADLVVHDPIRRSLGRTGTSLASCEDIDLAFTGCDAGFAAGRFCALKLTHLIPTRRLNLDYMARLAEEIAASQIVFRSLRETMTPPPPPRPLARLIRLWSRFRRDAASIRLNEARERGQARGFAVLAAQAPRA